MFSLIAQRSELGIFAAILWRCPRFLAPGALAVWLLLAGSFVEAGVKTHFALSRPSTAQVFLDYDDGSPTVDRTLVYGAPNDVMLLGDMDGDTIADLVIYRNGTWFINLMNDGIVDRIVVFGGDAADVPVIGDFLGNGKAGLGVFRAGVWYLSRLADGVADRILGFGTAGDIPLVADFDGDGKADCGVYRPTNGFWFISYGCTGALSESFAFGGIPGDLPVAADFGGTWEAGAGIYRNGTWFLSYKRNGVVDRIFGFGATGDRPLLGPMNPANAVFVAEGASGGNGSQSAPFATIAQAVAVTSPSMTVRIAAGHYAESVFLASKQGLTFLGAGIGATHLVGSGDTFVAQLSSDITLRNVHVASPSSRGIIAQGSSLTLDRVTTIGNRSHNLVGTGYLGIPGTLLVQYSKLDQSQLGNGLQLASDVTATVRNSTIDGNGSASPNDSTLGRGIEIFNGSVLILDLSSVSDNYFGGILLDHTARATVQNSNILRNGHNGISFNASSWGDISGNSINLNGVRGTSGPTTGYNGVELQDGWSGPAMSVHANTIAGNTTNGIYVGGGGSQVTVLGNYFYDNFVGLTVWLGGNVVVRGNTFELPLAQGNEEGIYMSGASVSVTLGGPASTDRNVFKNYVDNPTIHCDTVGGSPSVLCQMNWNSIQNCNLPNFGCNCGFP